MRIRKTIFPALFIGFVLAMAVSLAVGTYRELGIRGTAREMLSGLKNADPDGWEARVNEDLDGDHRFIELYGALQRAMGKRLVEDPAGNTVAKLSTGQLTFATITEHMDQTENAENITELHDALEGVGIPLELVIAPTKLSNPVAAMPDGAEDYGNAVADELIDKLSGRVETLDLRPDFVRADPDNSWFFNTDHHWRPEGALFSCGTLMEHLHERYGFEVKSEALDPDSYEVTRYPGLFLGSQGKRVGRYYAGVDDFTVLTPKFATDFEYTYDDLSEPRRGPFESSLCFPEMLKKDYFGGNPYTYYSGGDWGRGEAVNILDPDGPTVAIIRDSFSCALMPFLAIQCGKVVTYDMRAYEGDIVEELKELRPDCVLVLYTASSAKDPISFEGAK